MKSANQILQLVTAVLLLLCLLDMPYGFYQLVRFVSMCSFAYLSYDCYKQHKEKMCFIFAALALLFQPFAKIVLGRTVWNCVDVIVVVGLFYLNVKSNKQIRENKN